MRQAPGQFQQEFIQGVHQGFKHIVKSADHGEGSQGSRSGFSFKFWPFRRRNLSAVKKIMNGNSVAMVNEGRPLSPDSAKSSSTVNLNPSGRVNRIRPMSLTEDPGIHQAHGDLRPARLSYGAASSCQEIMVNVEEGKQQSEQESEQGAGSKGSGKLMIAAANPRTPPTIEIEELQAMGHCETNAQAGPQVVPRKGQVSNTSSFLDILFVETFERR
ncbi:hypothetical protein FOPG_18712 [Fusarium oxysporum f. sp. conglutinans race 2 54008]|nr:hypothetical protein FOPG_18712 [Fusarium oxysporum f. sp. conglutinans race 2 54008]KAG6989389.1 hypothetical protein FocnCong_v021072 [Fusarium oxysporum f. sp. conglutinans]KAI8404267.1 hypothetical protein FOFC_15762 [Fusarium oxysporum]